MRGISAFSKVSKNHNSFLHVWLTKYRKRTLAMTSTQSISRFQKLSGLSSYRKLN